MLSPAVLGPELVTEAHEVCMDSEACFGQQRLDEPTLHICWPHWATNVHGSCTSCFSISTTAATAGVATAQSDASVSCHTCITPLNVHKRAIVTRNVHHHKCEAL